MKKLYNRYDTYAVAFEFDKNSVDEVLLMLVKQSESTICKGVSILIRQDQFIPQDLTSCVNSIFADKITPYHMHDYCKINYVLEGTLAQYIDGKQYVLSKGDLLIMNPGICHASHPVGDAVAKNILISDTLIQSTLKILAANNVTNYLNSLMKNPVYQIFRKLDKTEIHKTIEELIRLFGSSMDTEFLPAKTKNLTEKLLIKLADCENFDHIASDDTGVTKHSRDVRILNYIAEHYSSISLEQIAKHFGYSEQQIRRIVKKNTGISYADYLRTYRIKKASSLLANTTIPVNEIARAIGFDSPEYFSRRFKMETDYSPLEFRAMMREKADSQETTEDL